MSGTSGKKYTLDSRLGGGGMAEVFRGRVVGAEGFTRTVAIKRVLPSFSSDDRFAKMFVNEARLSSFLNHQNIVSILDFDRDDEGALFLVMELVEGPDLAKLIETGALPRGLACFLTIEILRGLGFAHDLCREGKHLNIVHRDISPHNVLLSWDGAVKVSDFGIAKAFAATEATDSGVLKGKAAYMSPEQASAAVLDGRSDLFAVGAMLHELLTGQRLFAGNTVAETFAQMLAMPIRPPSAVRADVPADLDAVTVRLLARDREARFPSAHEAIWELQRCADAAPSAGATKDDLMVVLRERFPDTAPLNQSVRLRAEHLRTPGGRAASITPTAGSPPAGGDKTPATRIGTPASTQLPQLSLAAGLAVPSAPGAPRAPAALAPAGVAPVAAGAPIAAGGPAPRPAPPSASPGPAAMAGAGPSLGPDRPTLRAEGVALAAAYPPMGAAAGPTPPAVSPVGTPVDTPRDTAARSLELAALGHPAAPHAIHGPAGAAAAATGPARRRKTLPLLAFLGALAIAAAVIILSQGGERNRVASASLADAPLDAAGQESAAPAESSAGAAPASAAAPTGDAGSATEPPAGAITAAPHPPPTAVSAAASPTAAPTERMPAVESNATSGPRADNDRTHDKTIPVPSRPKGKGMLTIIAVPWAVVYIDGKRVGTTPVTLSVEAGTRKVVLENDDLGGKKTIRVNVPVNGKKTLEHTW